MVCINGLYHLPQPKYDKKQSENLDGRKIMFNFEVRSYESADIIEHKSPQTTKPPILFECVVLDVYTRNSMLFAYHSVRTACLSICVLGRLAVPVVVWVCLQYALFLFYKPFKILKLCYTLNVRYADTKRPTSMALDTFVMIAVPNWMSTIVPSKRFNTENC